MKICLYSLSPKIGGGVIVKTILLIKYFIEQKHEVTWVYPKVRSSYPTYVKKFINESNIKTIEINTIPYLRALDSFDFKNKITDEYDIYQVVSGYCLDGMIFRKFHKNYFIWSATTLKSEKYSIGIRGIASPKDFIGYINFLIGTFLKKKQQRMLIRFLQLLKKVEKTLTKN